VPESVDDPADPRLADYVDLRGGRADGVGPVIVEGWIAVEELLASGLEVRSVLVTPRKLARLPETPPGTNVYVAEEAVLRATVGFNLHRGVVASAVRPAPADPATILRGAGRVLVCERVNDLENLGSLFRNARAFAVDAVLLDPETTDPLARRPIRVSLGHALRVPFARVTDWPGALPGLLGDAGLASVALAPGGDTGLDALPERAAFLVGAEGPGLTAAALAVADRRIRIPMAAGVDSVNVATAAAIALSAHFGQTGADG
jgi:tRNA G18 (ribose-2'-O)-methylase SpoU